MIVKVGVYARLSREDKEKENKNDDSNSIINQKSMCIKYAVNQGWEVVDIYSDDDFSGAGTYRPEFERLISDCESGRINLVLCKSQSRFSRDMEVIERYLHNKFLEWGTRFVSIVDNADTNQEYNKKSRQINGLMNEWYLDDLSQNIKKSLKNKREDGLFMGSFAPFGYKRSEVDKHKLVIDPIAAEVIKKIFELYKNGLGYYKIAEYLNDNNIPTPSQYKKQIGSNFVCGKVDPDGVRWNMDTIAKILCNEVYIGNLVQGKKTSISYKVHKLKKVPKKEWCIVKNTHEPIIDKDTWNIVSKRLGSHERRTGNGEIHYLSQKVYCKECGRIFNRNTCQVKSEPSGLRVYLQCKGAKRFNICDNKRSIRCDELEKILLNEINKLLDYNYDKEELKQKYNKRREKTDITNQIKTLKNEIKTTNKKIENNKQYYKSLYENMVKGVVSEEMFKELSTDYLQDNENLSIRKDAILEELDKISNEDNSKNYAKDILKKYKRIDKLNKVIVDEFIDKVYIGAYDKETNSRDIEIEWNFEF